MANKYPYVPSAGPLTKTVAHLRKSFPKEVTADTLRKLGVAPKNESYVINVLRFIGVIDEEGKKVDANAKAFVQHDQEAFESALAGLVRDAYEELFEIHGQDAWSLNRNQLTQFFRTTDHSSEVVGIRQAGTFSALALLTGKAQASAARPGPDSIKRQPASSPAKRATRVSKSTENASRSRESEADVGTDRAPVGLTVRIEVNLPASGDQETYDRIFRSIRENLINGKIN